MDVIREKEKMDLIAVFPQKFRFKGLLYPVPYPLLQYHTAVKSTQFTKKNHSKMIIEKGKDRRSSLVLPSTEVQSRGKRGVEKREKTESSCKKT